MALALSGSVSISGSLNVGGSAVVLSSATSSLSASYAVNAVTASYVVSSVTDESQNTRLNTIEAVTGSYTLTSSFGTYTSSNDVTNTTQNSRIAANEAKTGSFATTGSNYFIGTQVITGSVYIANDLIVQGSSSLQNITASAVSIGTNKVILNTDTPILQFGGISVFDSGSTDGRSGSLFWNSLNDHWININPSGSDEGYNSAILINGPKNTGSLGNETGLTTNYIPVSQGEDHITDSIIFQSGSINIGIGNTNPVVRLQITQPNGIGLPTLGTSTGGLFIAGDGNQYGLYVGNDGNTGNAWIQSMRNNTATAYNILLNPVGGNIGIGTTNPEAQLEITSATGGTLRLKRNDGTVTTDETLGTLEFHTNDGDGPHIASYVRGLGADFPGSNFGRYGALSFGVSKTANTDAVEVMRIDLEGKVGIGTTSPSYLLDVNGTGRFSGNLLGTGNIQLTGDGYVYGNATAGNGTIRAGIRFNSTSQELKFFTADAGRLTIDNTGSSTFLSSTFSVAKFNSTYGQINIDFQNSGTTFASIGSGVSVCSTAAADDTGIGTAGLNKSIVFATGTSFLERMRITSNGLVGIGTTNPAGQLSGTIGLSIVNATNAALGLSNGTNHWLNYLSGTTYRIWNNSVSEVMTILLNGNIGIGTVSPASKLEVIGDIRAGSFGLNSDSVFRGGLYPYKFIAGSGTDYGVTIFSEGGTGNGNIYFCPGGSSTRQATITTGGSLLVGTTSNFSSLRLQVAGRIYAEGLLGYSYSQTSTSGTTSIVDTFIDNNSFGQSALYMISYGGNPNAAGSGAYKANYVGYVSVTTGFIGGSVKRLISYTPAAQFDSSAIGSLTLTAFFFNGTTEATTINEGSTSGYYIRLKITGYNSSFVGTEQYVYLTKLN
jgi:hypothetical protein